MRIFCSPFDVSDTLNAEGKCWYALELKPLVVLGRSSTISYSAFLRIGTPFVIEFQTCVSKPHAVGSVSTRDPPIFLIHLLHTLINLVPAVQLIFLGSRAIATRLSSSSAYATDTLVIFNDFASLDQKSLFASFHSP